MAGLVQKIKDMWNPPEDEYDEYYEEDQQQEIFSSEEPRETAPQQRDVIRRAPVSPQLQVVLFKPEHFGEETTAVADELLKMHTVVLNLENTNKDISRRILDFLSGVTYANNGKIKRVATSTFIITPYNVDLTGDDLLDELENSGVYF